MLLGTVSEVYETLAFCVKILEVRVSTFLRLADLLAFCVICCQVVVPPSEDAWLGPGEAHACVARVCREDPGPSAVPSFTLKSSFSPCPLNIWVSAFISPQTGPRPVWEAQLGVGG